MPSVFAFYRARGVPGAYVVGIELDLLPTEIGYVKLIPYRSAEKPQAPIKTVKEEGERALYHIERICIGDTIAIDIADTQLVPYQQTQYLAEEDGFRVTHLPYMLSSWQGWSKNYGVITLNPITVIDLDTEDVVIQQEERVVDALPAQTEPVKQQRVYKPRQKRTLQPHGNHSEQPANIEDPTFQF